MLLQLMKDFALIQHNDANVLVMPGRFIDTDMADKIMTEFFETPFEGGRHEGRIAKIPVR